MVKSYSEPHRTILESIQITQRKYEPRYSNHLNKSVLLTSVELVKFWCVKRLSQMAKAGFG